MWKEIALLTTWRVSAELADSWQLRNIICHASTTLIALALPRFLRYRFLVSLDTRHKDQLFWYCWMICIITVQYSTVRLSVRFHGLPLGYCILGSFRCTGPLDDPILGFTNSVYWFLCCLYELSLLVPILPLRTQFTGSYDAFIGSSLSVTL
jgi:hypothetical protein